MFTTVSLDHTNEGIQVLRPRPRVDMTAEARDTAQMKEVVHTSSQCRQQYMLCVTVQPAAGMQSQDGQIFRVFERSQISGFSSET